MTDLSTTYTSTSGDRSGYEQGKLRGGTLISREKAIGRRLQEKREKPVLRRKAAGAKAPEDSKGRIAATRLADRAPIIRQRGPSWCADWLSLVDGKKVRRYFSIGRVADMTKDEALQCALRLQRDDMAEAKAVATDWRTSRLTEQILSKSQCVSSNISVSGEIGEQVVVLDLLSRGHDVFKAVNRNSKCDIIALIDGKTVRVEVKRGQLTKSGRMDCEITDRSYFDVLAFVDHAGHVTYLLPDELSHERRPKVVQSLVAESMIRKRK